MFDRTQSLETRQRKTPDKIGQSAHWAAKTEVRDKIKIFTDFE